MTPETIPLSLYIHIPWCVRKCPYCDFNSHTAPIELNEARYRDTLLADLTQDSDLVENRTIQTIFIGGGTPSLYSAKTIAQILDQASRIVPFATDIEVTLEANPGTVDNQRFTDYRAAGINRLSIGIQSLNDTKLRALGRIHGRNEARTAIRAAQQAGFEQINLDLMYGLPEQTMTEALQDLQELLSYQTSHISWYQLTLEPNTLFYRQPPAIPDEDTTADIMQAGQTQLAAHGYQQYEISAYSQPGSHCRHNLNYWQFGDYLGIGAGAHSKLTLADGRIIRRNKYRHPEQYQRATHYLHHKHTLTREALPLEFMLNALRLTHGVPITLFTGRTGLSYTTIHQPIQTAVTQELLKPVTTHLQPTQRGHLFLNNLLAHFDTT
ncbi:MAG: radical SAM family heme chaperone HemW [Pseudomonadota bacterium]